VTSLDEGTATSMLEDAGFVVEVQDVPTSDPSQDGIVVSQDPPKGKAKPGATVTIAVGRLAVETETTTTATTSDTTTTATTTTATTTAPTG
jgi:beta-lactam-binding protein with PASTA domain